MAEGVQEVNKRRQAYRKKHPPSEAALRIVDAIMARPPNLEISFELHPSANPPSKVDGLLRQVTLGLDCY